MSTFEPTSGKRQCRVEKLPSDLRPAICNLNDQQWWFPLWVRGDCNWLNVQYQELLKKQEKNTDEDEEAWVTRAQAIHIFKCPIVGGAVCDEKAKSVKTSRPHEDVPWLPEARQYLATFDIKHYSIFVRNHVLIVIT